MILQVVDAAKQHTAIYYASTYLQCTRCLTVRSGVPRGYVCILVPAAPGVRPPAAVR